MKLNAMMAMPGVQAAVMVGLDGLALEAHGADAERLAAELAALRTSMERITRRLEAGGISRVAFTSDKYEVVAVALPNMMLAALLARGVDTRAAQQELARVALDVQAGR
ncbi:roadblock/LC7 domain-containing protein [Deinococcus maricopensis]|uniref:Roadblock/LC7 family protein n=1 Tax=Deinococcus maricopensis (strain DSM 21211 / LMG 22137 / NRRL B-23946 / LB-34) TaxID=709986 RepID=E8U5Z9_DEIML|nr:roadblock/LC7 domain-containing protein [Deinococcus maricopensis]ADV66488.1 Roadblock/LC7 family protein [Deinococcus maricopensis DSM 21211]